MNEIKSAKDLDVFKRSYRLALEAHKDSVAMLSRDGRELASQLRRTSKSIPTNIVEGFAKRKSPKEYTRFLGISLASCDEIFVHLDFAHDLGYFPQEKYDYYKKEYTIVGKQLTNLRKIWRGFTN